MHGGHVNWSEIDAAFATLMWIVVLVLAAVILAESVPRSQPSRQAPTHGMER